MNWLLLLIAGCFEIAWAIGLKYSEGFSRFWPSLFTLIAMVLSVVLLGVAMRSLPVGTAYAVWVGIGVAGTVILGVFLFAEPLHWVRGLSVALILLGVAGLKLSS